MRHGLVLIFCCLAMAAPQVRASDAELVIIFSGGRRGQLEGDSLAREATLRRHLLKQQPVGNVRVIALDTGDTLFPGALSKFDGGSTVFNALATSGCNYLSPGTHDLDIGPDKLRKLAAEGTPELLSACIKNPNTDLLAFSPYRILTIGTFRIALVGVARPDLLHQLAGHAAKRIAMVPPEQSLRRQVDGLSRSKAADAFVAFGNVDHHQAYALARAVPEVCAIVGGGHSADRGADTVVWSFDKGRGRNIDTPVRVHPQREGVSLGFLSLRFDANGKDWRLKRAVTRQTSIDAAIPADKAISSYLRDLRGRYAIQRIPVLTSINELFQNDLTTTRFATFASSVLREKAGAEIAVLHTRLFNPTAIEELQQAHALYSDDLTRIVRYDDTIVGCRLRGTDVHQLFKAQRPSEPLVFTGLTTRHKKLVVNGRPLLNNQWYTVATSSYLLSPDSVYPQLAKSTDKQRAFDIDVHGYLRPTSEREPRGVTVRDLLAHVLATEIQPANTDAVNDTPIRLYEQLAMRRVPAWLIDLDNLRFTFSLTRADHNDAFEPVRDKRANAADQDVITGAGRLRIARQSADLNLEFSTFGRYTRVKVQGEETETSVDDLRLRFEASPVFLRFPTPLSNVELAPFGSTELDTEFEHPKDSTGKNTHRQNELFLTLGLLQPYPSDVFDEFRLGTFASYNYTDPKEDPWQGGMELELRHTRALWSDLKFRVGMRGRWFAVDSQPDDGDLIWFAEPYALVTIPFVLDLKFIAEVNGYIFKARRVSEIGSSYTAALGFSFSQLWKLTREW